MILSGADPIAAGHPGGLEPARTAGVQALPVLAAHLQVSGQPMDVRVNGTRFIRPTEATNGRGISGVDAPQLLSASCRRPYPDSRWQTAYRSGRQTTRSSGRS